MTDKMREALIDAVMQPSLDEIVKAAIAHGVEDAPNEKNEMRHRRIASMVRALFADRYQAAQSVPVVGEPTDAAYKWMIANGVEPLTSLHKLGERLAAFLDEDQFSGCETLLLTAITAINTFVPVPAAELATLREKAAMADELRGKLEISECGMAAALAEGDRIMSDWQEQIRKTCAALKQRNDAEKERDELRKDAARGRLLIERGEWIRRNHDTDEAHSLLAIRLPYDADLSCKAMCENAIDAAIAQGQTK